MADIGYVLGTGSGDVGTNCASNANKKWALYHPIVHPNLSHVTLTERIQKFHSLTPKDMASIRSLNTFATVPTPEAWGYNKPTGTIGTAPYRALDYAHIESDLTKIATDWGYNHNADAPLIMNTDVSVALSTDPDTGDWLCPTFKYDEHSVNQYGSADIEMYLRDLIFRYYGQRDSQPAWQLPSSYDDIFNSDNLLTTGVWRFAIALALKTSASGPYVWRIVSSPEPLSNPFIGTQSDMLKHVIRPSYNQKVANAIKYVVRNYEQTQIDCIPFLACNLQYSEDQGWYFGGSNNDRAITFPNGDMFKLTPTGFATQIVIGYSGFRVAYTNTNSATQNISGLTWYSATGITYQGSPALAIALPRPPSGMNYCIMEFTFTLNTHFGITSNMIAGYGVGSASDPGQLYTNDGTAIDNISGEWVNSSRTCKVRCMGPTFYSLMSQAPESAFPLQIEDFFKVYFSNTQLAGVQNKLNAWGLISLQS